MDVAGSRDECFRCHTPRPAHLTGLAAGALQRPVKSAYLVAVLGARNSRMATLKLLRTLVEKNNPLIHHGGKPMAQTKAESRGLISVPKTLQVVLPPHTPAHAPPLKGQLKWLH